MRWAFGLGGLAALAGVASASSQANTVTVYNDAETGFTFSQYQATYSLSGKYITFRIAVPSTAQQDQSYDAVVQIVAPSEVGWLGLAWGGSMTYNPLTVSWANGNTPVVSSRYATSHVLPSTYSSATYEVFKTGTKSNGTHWQFTAKCSGCTSYSGASGSQRYLNPKGGNRLAFAYAAQKPSNPSSASSSFNVHDVFGYWTHDFSLAQNPSFAALVTKNGGHTTSGAAAAAGRRGKKVRMIYEDDEAFAGEEWE